MSVDPALRTAALASKAWPYEEARKVLKRYPQGKAGGAPILFETGYGPSGLPYRDFQRSAPHDDGAPRA